MAIGKNDHGKPEEFGSREVGLSHPDVQGFVRITDNSEIQIVASESLAIFMNPQNNSITFVADSVKFITKENGGLKWNGLEFNPKATSFNEPTFTRDDRENKGLYRGVDYFLEPGEDI